jgi:hypothetical protein
LPFNHNTNRSLSSGVINEVKFPPSTPPNSFQIVLAAFQSFTYLNSIQPDVIPLALPKTVVEPKGLKKAAVGLTACKQRKKQAAAQSLGGMRYTDV